MKQAEADKAKKEADDAKRQKELQEAQDKLNSMQINPTQQRNYQPPKTFTD